MPGPWDYAIQGFNKGLPLGIRSAEREEDLALRKSERAEDVEFRQEGLGIRQKAESRQQKKFEQETEILTDAQEDKKLSDKARHATGIAMAFNNAGKPVQGAKILMDFMNEGLDENQKYMIIQRGQGGQDSPAFKNVPAGTDLLLMGPNMTKPAKLKNLGFLIDLVAAKGKLPKVQATRKKAQADLAKLNAEAQLYKNTWKGKDGKRYYNVYGMGKTGVPEKIYENVYTGKERMGKTRAELQAEGLPGTDLQVEQKMGITTKSAAPIKPGGIEDVEAEGKRLTNQKKRLSILISKLNSTVKMFKPEVKKGWDEETMMPTEKGNEAIVEAEALVAKADAGEEVSVSEKKLAWARKIMGFYNQIITFGDKASPEKLGIKEMKKMVPDQMAAGSGTFNRPALESYMQ